MKKSFMTLGLMLGMLSLTGCQKDVDNSANIENEQQTITRTITVEGEWEGDTRSEYVEGEGVQLTGKEVLTVYYGDAQYTANDTADASKLAKTKADPSGEGDFLYTFSHSAIGGAAAYDYYFIMPNTTTNNMQSKGHRPMVYLNTIQAPKANTFDAAQDYLVGQPLLNQSEAATSATIRFKRMFAPLRMMVKNGGALLEGEKILYATISQSATCTAKNPLVGTAYFRFSPGNDAPEKSDAYEDARIRNFLSTGYGNKVTAFYPTGLETAGEGYPVWYIINPSNTDNDTPTTISGDMTVTLVTDQRMLSRTVTLANPMEFAANKLNQFSITFGNDVDVVAGEAVTTTFANYNSLEDLEQEGWMFEHSTYNNKSIEIANSTTNAGKISLPMTAGKKITKIIVLPSLYHPNNSNLNNFELHAGDTTVESFNFNAQNMLTSAENMYGYLVIDVPVEHQTAQLTLVKPTTDKAKCSIRAITLIYEDSTAPAASVEFASADLEELTFNVEMANAEKYYYLCQPSSEEAPTAEEVVSNGTEATATNLTITGLNEATAYTLYVVAVKGDTKSSVASAEGKTKNSATDYYEQGVTINGVFYDKNSAGAELITDASKFTHSYVGKGGVFFIDTDDVIAWADHAYTHVEGAKLVIIGRFNNKQAQITLDGTKTIQCNRAANTQVIFKNVYLASASEDTGQARRAFTTAGNLDTASELVYLEDCTFDGFKSVIYDGASSTNTVFKNIVVNNCIIGNFPLASQGVIWMTSKGSTGVKDYSLAQTFTFTNNVVFQKEAIQYYLYNGGDASSYNNLTNLKITVTNNSFYNIWQSNGLVRGTVFNSAVFSNNVGWFDNISAGNKTTYVVGNFTPTTEATIMVENNHLTTNGTSNGWKTYNAERHQAYEFTNCVVQNKDAAGAYFPYADMLDASIGYFPVNTTVVTNGAGASYDTKLWYNWGE